MQQILTCAATALMSSGHARHAAQLPPKRRRVATPQDRPEPGDCAICFGRMNQPVVTPCGHSFCSSCLDKYLGFASAGMVSKPCVKVGREEKSDTTHNSQSANDRSGRSTYAPIEKSPLIQPARTPSSRIAKPCPTCAESLDDDTVLYPNVALSRMLMSAQRVDLITNVTSRVHISSGGEPRVDDIANIDVNVLTENQIQNLLNAILRRQNAVDNEMGHVGAEMTLDFLAQARKLRRAARDAAQRDLEIIDHDLAVLKSRFPDAGLTLSEELLAEINHALPDSKQHVSNLCTGSLTEKCLSSSSLPGLRTADSHGGDAALHAIPLQTTKALSERRNSVLPDSAESIDDITRTLGRRWSEENGRLQCQSRNTAQGCSAEPSSDKQRCNAIQNRSAIVAKNSSYPLTRQIQARKSLVDRFHSDVQSMYFDRRRRMGTAGLQSITDTLLCATNLSSARKQACVKQVDIFNTGQNLISSVEFNANGTVFATGGVAKRIKLFELSSVLAASREDGTSAENLHVPVLEIATQAKLTSLSWNHKRDGVLAAAAFNGAVLVYDTAANAEIHNFAEHNVRTWSIDFSTQQPTLMLSGSDDNTVRLWDVGRLHKSILTLPTNASVCSVRFNPYTSHELAFGSADHNVYSYDIRHPSSPLCVYEGHWRAVSYVFFLNRADLISASTDSSCKLWNAREQEPGLSYGGHKNERNFVGLCGNGEFFACGSEDNAVYIYHKGLAGPIIRYGLASPGVFASSVSWKPNSNLLVTANNTGALEIFELE